ncbi:unnamed protein product [Durusdinium trenchii]|uniref:Protein TALPID3 n=1 Tax=Durusdinium trenchii TaxID=1381693 RepID=A0ABP0LKY0_9DINO
MAWPRARRLAVAPPGPNAQSGAKARPKGMATRVQAREPRELRDVRGAATSATSQTRRETVIELQDPTEATQEALFGENPFLGVECMSTPALGSGSVQQVHGVASSASTACQVQLDDPPGLSIHPPCTPLAWQDEDTLVEEKSLSPIGGASPQVRNTGPLPVACSLCSVQAFTPNSPPTFVSSQIQRPPSPEGNVSAEDGAVKQIADIVADAEAKIMRRMEGWTSEGSIMHQLASGTVSDLRLSSAIAGDCLKLKSTVEDLKGRMSSLADENHRLRSRLRDELTRPEESRTPRTPPSELHSMLQMMQQQLQQQQQLIELLGTRPWAGVTTPPAPPAAPGTATKAPLTAEAPLPGRAGSAGCTWRLSAAPDHSAVALAEPITRLVAREGPPKNGARAELLVTPPVTPPAPLPAPPTAPRRCLTPRGLTALTPGRDGPHLLERCGPLLDNSAPMGCPRRSLTRATSAPARRGGPSPAFLGVQAAQQVKTKPLHTWAREVATVPGRCAPGVHLGGWGMPRPAPWPGGPRPCPARACVPGPCVRPLFSGSGAARTLNG